MLAETIAEYIVTGAVKRFALACLLDPIEFFPPFFFCWIWFFLVADAWRWLMWVK